MKTFTIIKSHVGNNLYSLVLVSTMIVDGKEVKEGLNLSNITLEEADNTEQLFRLYGSKLLGNK